MLKEKELNDRYQRSKVGQPVNFGDVIQVTNEAAELHL
jgi:hypothetical protein